MTGCSVRTTNGIPIKISASVIPSGLNTAWMPNGSRYWPNQPVGA